MSSVNTGFDSFSGYLDSQDSIDHAITALENGEVVGVSNTSVYALLGSLATPEAGQRLYEAKERPSTRTVAALLPAEKFGEYADMDRLGSATQQLLEDPDLIRHSIADLAFVRFPVKKSVVSAMSEATIRMMISHQPSGTDSIPFLQGFASEADTEFKELEKVILRKGLPHPVITSMNVSGKPEITRPIDAQAFCSYSNIPLLDNRNGRNPVSHGSFPIFEATPNGLVCKRVGNISTTIMRLILEPVISYELSTQSANRPHVRALALGDIPTIWQNNLIGKQAREAVIDQRLSFESSRQAA